MFIQTEKTPNPNSLKFIPGKKVLHEGVIEIFKKTETENQLIKNIMSVDGVVSILLSEDFLSLAGSLSESAFVFRCIVVESNFLTMFFNSELASYICLNPS